MTDRLSRFVVSRVLAVILAPLLCLVATSAHAVQQWSKAGNWQILMDPGDNCFAASEYTGNWVLALSMTAERQSIAIIGGPVPYAIDARPTLIWTTSDGTSFSGQSIVSAMEGGKRALMLGSADFLAKMEVATSVRIDDADGKIVSFNLKDTAAAIAELRRCMTELIKLDIGSGLPAATKPVPRNLASVVTSDDYPAKAVRAEVSGRTRVALTVSAHGLVSDCSVTASSGSTDLDDATCRLMRLRAKFTPASDAANKPTAARYETSVNWQVPPS